MLPCRCAGGKFFFFFFFAFKDPLKKLEAKTKKKKRQFGSHTFSYVFNEAAKKELTQIISLSDLNVLLRISKRQIIFLC